MTLTLRSGSGLRTAQSAAVEILFQIAHMQLQLHCFKKLWVNNCIYAPYSFTRFSAVAEFLIVVSALFLVCPIAK